MIDDMILTFSILHGNVLYVNIFEIILHDDNYYLQVDILCVAGRPVALLHVCYQKQWEKNRYDLTCTRCGETVT